MDENIFDKDSFDAIKPVDLKETMETSYICLLYTSDAADEL